MTGMMTGIRRQVRFLLLGSLCAALSACAHAAPGTAEDREALYEEIVTRIMEREAFSPLKNERFDLAFPEALAPYREQFINADTDEALYWALVRLSNARHDRHLDVTPVDGGITIPLSYNRFDSADFGGMALDPDLPPVAPVRFLPDYSAQPVTFFVSDVASDLSMVEDAGQIAIGDVVVSVNGAPFERYLADIAPYRAHSTLENFWMRAAMDMNLKTAILPESLYGSDLALVMRKPGGATYEVSLPYLPSETVSFQGVGEARYEGFEKVLEAESFNVWRSAPDREIILIDMYGFRADLVTATDSLIAYADREGILHYDVIVDATRSRGGGRGAYLVQAISPKPFRTTFGNLRLSDVIPKFTSDRRAQLERGEEFSDGSPETVGDPWWLIEWLEGDVAKGLAAGQAYSNNVPFKSAHAPAWSDGTLPPADKHFTGQMVCWYSPYGGSHLDQFAAITYDNDLCTAIGMPTGGFSNTWEWDEILTFPGTGQPVARFMWNIGHTIRPNGDILEGNPPEVNEYIPLTAANHESYYDLLLERSLELLELTQTDAPQRAGQQ